MNINSIASSQLQTSMIRIASGQRINSARDDAAGLAISESLGSQIRGLDQGTNNVLDMQNLVNTAEGGLDTISNNLQRIRELGVQANNGILTERNREIIQTEIDQLMAEIDHTTQRVEFNSMRLLDGGFNAEDNRYLHTAGDAGGRGPTVVLGNMSASMLLGPEAVDVVNEPMDLSRIDNALSRVNAQRSYLGAMSNRFDATVATNQITNLNLAAGRSRIRDADVALEAMRMRQEETLQEARLAAQQRRQEDEGINIMSLLG
ncbi:MAG: flagellin [Defluviitaleaceae bacterium]|nr:flagellin [Defluviitaleaceae bacterium]